MGLVAYGSSDEETEDEQRHVNDVETKASEIPSAQDEAPVPSHIEPKQNGYGAAEEAEQRAPIVPDLSAAAPIIGPALGPSAENSTASLLPESDEIIDAPPRSPYSAGRALLRDLTMPSVPNFDIPPSPPGSPPPATEKKFAHFLQLKKQGVHFNEKLAKSSALKNPSLMQKLMDFADISEEEQYASTLPKDVWDPSGFPKWAYKEELKKSADKILKQREAEKVGAPRDFVPATTSGDSSRGGTPGIVSRGGPMSAAERVMAGLDRGQSNSPQVAGVKRKTRFES